MQSQQVQPGLEDLSNTSPAKDVTAGEPVIFEIRLKPDRRRKDESDFEKGDY